MVPMAVTIRKVSLQSKPWPIRDPSGTPITVAIVRPPIMRATAKPDFSFGTIDPAKTPPTPKKKPWGNAIMMRDINSVECLRT